MKYQAPFGSADPGAPYVDKNTPGAVAGSKVPAKAIEHPQRELDTLIEKSGLTPSEADLTQLTHAVRSQKLNYVTAGGTANAITFTLDPAPANWAALEGVPFKLKFAAQNTGAVTININGFGTKALTRVDGIALEGGEVGPGQIWDVVYDGTQVQLLGYSSIVAKPVNSQTFTTAGADTFTVPAGISFVYVEAWGGGGGGGGTGAAASAGGGGGGGEYRSGWVAVTPGDAIAVTVGAGGTGGNTSGTNGSAGATSSFGALVSCGGGGGGTGSNSGGANGGAGGSGGAGGVTSFEGASGQTSYILGSSAIGGAGGAPFGLPGAFSIASASGSIGGRDGPSAGSGAGGGANGGAGGDGGDGRVTVQWG